jgi:hypothetical protein
MLCYRIQDVFKWQLEVEDDVSNAEHIECSYAYQFGRITKA